MSETPSPSRRRFFSKLLSTDSDAPNRAVWHRVPEVGASDGDVLWSGLVINNTLMVVGDEGMVLRYNGEADIKYSIFIVARTLLSVPSSSTYMS